MASGSEPHDGQRTFPTSRGPHRAGRGDSRPQRRSTRRRDRPASSTSSPRRARGRSRDAEGGFGNYDTNTGRGWASEPTHSSTTRRRSPISSRERAIPERQLGQEPVNLARALATVGQLGRLSLAGFEARPGCPSSSSHEAAAAPDRPDHRRQQPSDKQTCVRAQREDEAVLLVKARCGSGHTNSVNFVDLPTGSECPFSSCEFPGRSSRAMGAEALNHFHIGPGPPAPSGSSTATRAARLRAPRRSTPAATRERPSSSGTPVPGPALHGRKLPRGGQQRLRHALDGARLPRLPDPRWARDPRARARAFRAPTFTIFSSPARDSTLQPETSFPGRRAGPEALKDRIRLGLTYFRNTSRT